MQTFSLEVKIIIDVVFKGLSQCRNLHCSYMLRYLLISTVLTTRSNFSYIAIYKYIFTKNEEVFIWQWASMTSNLCRQYIDWAFDTQFGLLHFNQLVWLVAIVRSPYYWSPYHIHAVRFSIALNIPWKDTVLVCTLILRWVSKFKNTG